MALLAALVAIYLLRVRRQRVVVASLMLWRRRDEEATGSALWRWLRRHVLLMLQILALIALVLALARPQRVWERPALADLVLVVDGSSRLATGSAGFDGVKTAALAYLRALRQPVAVSVIGARTSAQTVALREASVPAAERAIRRLEAGLGPANMSLALSMAQSILRNGPGGSIAIVSDGYFEIDDPSLLAGAGLVEVAGSRGNLALERIAFRADPAGGSQVLVAVTSELGARRTVEVALMRDGVEVGAKPLEIEGNGRYLAIFEGVESGGDLVAEIRRSGLPVDADDRAYLPQRSLGGMRAAVVSDEPSAFVRALDALPEVLVQEVNPSAYDPKAEFDLYIFDGFVPESLPLASLIVVDPPADSRWFPRAEASSSTVPLKAEGARLLDFVDLGFLEPGEAGALVVPEWASPDLLRDEGAAIYHGLLEGRRTVVVAFDPVESGMADSAAFPIFVHNAVQWVNPLHALPPGASVMLGEPASVYPHPRATQLEVIHPGGQTQRIAEVRPGLAIGPFDEPGIYRIKQIGAQVVIGEEAFSVGLPMADDYAPAGKLSLPPPPPLPLPEAGGEAQRTALWTWVALAALIVMAGEWVWFHRVRTAS